jgi:hypothetical protein
LFIIFFRSFVRDSQTQDTSQTSNPTFEPRLGPQNPAIADCTVLIWSCVLTKTKAATEFPSTHTIVAIAMADYEAPSGPPPPKVPEGWVARWNEQYKVSKPRRGWDIVLPGTAADWRKRNRWPQTAEHTGLTRTALPSGMVLRQHPHQEIPMGPANGAGQGSRPRRRRRPTSLHPGQRAIAHRRQEAPHRRQHEPLWRRWRQLLGAGR